ncbi:MAG: asparagine synthase B [Christensenellaceae bacterium]|jgi:asparagine synthase (glutamine-hydrolysing)|nr:asparagine synthase B [Christensenellaceae bacterium]
MCSIIGYEGNDVTLQEINAAFDKTYGRGPDARYIETVKGGYIGFNRLAIMGLSSLGMQPFSLKGNLSVCNGEVYRFHIFRDKLIEDGYSFRSNSDCEVILPLYEEYGVEMFKMLDAEFAIVIYDRRSQKMVAARDPIGIRPLFYGYSKSGKIMFASEAKVILSLTDNVKPFPPGHYYKDGEFVCYNNISEVAAYNKDNHAVIYKKINKLLTEGVLKRLEADTPVGFLLSGGLDSSLVCAIAAKYYKETNGKKIRTFGVGMTTDAIDLKYAKIVADYIESDHTEIYIDKDIVLKSLEKVIYTLETYDITTIRASMGMYLICKEIHEKTDIRVLLTGEISDELFGYKYTDYAPNAEEFQKESAKRIRELYMYDVLRADRCISSNSIEARVPFGDIAFVEYVMSIDPTKKLNTYNMGKYLLRKAFEGDKHGDYLPTEILYRQKAAFSDAVGHSLVDYLKEYAEAQYTDKEFKQKAAKYTHATPFTKESLLYREIFEKYYPGHADLVDDFWMPNKTWENCNVNDPSARVLKNYGDSGK